MGTHFGVKTRKADGGAVDIAMERMIAEMVKKLAVQRVFSRPQIVSWEMVQEGLCQRWKSNVLIVDCPWGDALDINAVDIKIDCG